MIPRWASGPRVLPVAIALTVILVGVAGWSLLRWHQTSTSQDLRLGRDRDAALATAGEVSVALSTLDHRHPRLPADRWRDTTTGALREVLASGADSYAELVRAGRLSTTASVTGSALSAMDRAGDTATALVGLDVTGQGPTGGPSTQHERLVLTLVREAGTWKVSSMKPVGS